MSQEELSSDPAPHRFQKRGFSYEKTIKYFFASNAGLTIVILALIIVFLLKEGLGFFPGYQRELQVYRIAGLEFVDISRKNLTAHEQLASVLNRAYFAEINGRCARQLRRTQEASAFFNAYTDQIGATRDLVLSNSQPDSAPNPQMLANLMANYEKQKLKALSSLPATPHLTAAERRDLTQALRNRPVDATEDPAFVAALAEEFAAAQQQQAEPLLALRTTIDTFEAAGSELGTLVSEMTGSVTATKEKIQGADILERDRKTLLAAAASAKDSAEREKLTAEAMASLADKPDVEGPLQLLLERRPDCVKAVSALKETSASIIGQLPETLTQPEAARLLKVARKTWPLFIADLAKTPAAITAWKHDTPVPLTAAIASFLTGKDWVTGGEWQDFYGILPLAAGSLWLRVLPPALTLDFTRMPLATVSL